MKKQVAIIVLILILVATIFTGCTAEVTIPHSSDEYKSGEWSADELVVHLKELGFSKIETDFEITFDEEKAGITRVVIAEDDSWSPQFVQFEKGETYDPSLKVCVDAYIFTPTITVDNSPEFLNLVDMGNESSDTDEAWNSFMMSHIGEYIEFDATISECNDEFFYISGIGLYMHVEGRSQTELIFDIELLDLEKITDFQYTHDKYHVGLFAEGMNTHMIVKIESSNDDWCLQIDTMEIAE